METVRPSLRKDGPIVLGLLSFALLIRCWFLSGPYKQYFDEIYYPDAAVQYLTGQIDRNDVHPPGAKLFMALFMEIWWGIERFVLHNFNTDPVAISTISWRWGSLVLGLAIIGMTYFMALSMFRTRLVAFLGAFFVSIDMLHIAQSRVAMLDMYEAFWIMLGLYFTWLYIKTDEGDTKWAVWAGLAYGCGVATKWSVLFAMVGALVAIFLLKDHPRRNGNPWLSRCISTAKALGIGAALTVLMYAMAFIPLVRAEATSNNPPRPIQNPTFYQQLNEAWKHIVYSHKRMWAFRHDPNQFKHRYLSQWYEWPTCIRPIWYIYDEEPDGRLSVFQTFNKAPWFTSMFGEMTGEKDKWVRGMIALGSVWTWWFFLLFLLVAIVRGGLSLYFTFATRCYTAPPPPDPDSRASLEEWKQSWFDGDEKGLIFLVVTYLPQLLFWSVNPGFFFYMLPCVPLMSMLVGHTIADWREMPLGRVVMTVFITVAILWTAVYWPLLVAYPVPKPYFEHLMLTKHWI